MKVCDISRKHLVEAVAGGLSFSVPAAHVGEHIVGAFACWLLYLYFSFLHSAAGLCDDSVTVFRQECRQQSHHLEPGGTASR